MTFNPWTRASEIVLGAINDFLEFRSGLETLSWIPAGDPGTDTFSQYRVDKLEGMDVSVKFKVPNPQKLSLRGRDINTMWLGMDLEIGWEESYKIAKMGALIDGMDRMIEAGLIDIAKTVWQGTTEALNGLAIDGLVAAGSGTFASPSILDAGTTAGAWDTAGNAAKDINALYTTLRKNRLPRPYVAFVPLDALDLVAYPLPVATGEFGERNILDLLTATFDAVVFTDHDDDGYNVITGNAETSTDCQIYAAATSTLKIVYQKDFQIQSLPWDEDTRKGKIRYDGKIGWYSLPIETSSGTFQKGICEIDSISLT